MTLGVGVPVAVRHDLVLAELAAVRKRQGRHAADPVTVTLDEALHADRPGAVGVADHGRQQGQPCGRDGREACAYPPLLAGDDLGGGAADWQPPPLAGALVIVIDQHRRAVGVEGQAVEGQSADLVGPAPGVHEQLDAGANLRPARAPFQAGQPGGEGAHDLGWQVTAGLGQLGRLRHIPGGEHEISAQPGRWLGGRGQAERANTVKHPPQVLADPNPPVPRDQPGRFQVGEPVQKRFDVAAAKGAGLLAAVATGDAQMH